MLDGAKRVPLLGVPISPEAKTSGTVEVYVRSWNNGTSAPFELGSNVLQVLERYILPQLIARSAVRILYWVTTDSSVRKVCCCICHSPLEAHLYTSLLHTFSRMFNCGMLAHRAGFLWGFGFRELEIAAHQHPLNEGKLNHQDRPSDRRPRYL